MGPECLDRINHPKMAYYRDTYSESRRWNGAETIKDKTVIVYCEQGYGDAIQFVRYVPLLKEQCGKVILHCRTDLHRLFKQFGVQLLDREDPNIPEHDYHVLSMSLPFVLNKIDVIAPYIKMDEKVELPEHQNFIKIGIAWEGNPEHSNADERNCPLKFFRALQTDKTKLFMIQKQAHSSSLVADATDMELFGAELNDFYDTAKLINSMDFVVAVDTSVLHLSAAMGKPTFGLLSNRHDPRWGVLHWYEDLVLIKQKKADDWATAFVSLIGFLKAKGLL